MKIAFISKYNNGYINQLTNDTIHFNSYSEGVNFLTNDFYYHYGSLSYYLNENGHQTMLLIPNYEKLQNLWCTEHGIHPKNSNAIETVKNQIDKFDPDIVFLNSNFEYYEQLIPYLKEKGIKICAWISCPIPTGINLLAIDHIFTLFEPHFQLFKKMGISATLTHGGFDERVLSGLSGLKKYPLTFIGGIGAMHKKREAFLKKVIRQHDLKIWGYGYTSHKKWKAVAKQVQQKFVFNKAFQGEAWGKEMFKILNESQITLNFHGDIATGYAVNMRLFEATGAGTLLITENTENINQFFEVGKEVVVYNSTEDAIDKINYYLSHPEKAEKIALAGQKKTLAKYNYKNMIQDYITVFEYLLNNEK